MLNFCETKMLNFLENNAKTISSFREIFGFFRGTDLREINLPLNSKTHFSFE